MKHQKRNHSLSTTTPRTKTSAPQENRNFQKAKQLIDQLNKQQEVALQIIQSSACHT